MCGIAGFVGKGDEQVLKRMARALHHRGPDDHGVLQEGKVGLAHTRLAVIDPSPAGHQPMQSRDNTVSLTYNGEVYNYRELRETLRGKGEKFISDTDTEVIIKLYEELGEQAFAHLEGMFAFALYDKKIDTLFLVRDRMGEKPLYWSLVAETLIFGSEPKALLEHPRMHAKVRAEGLLSYLTYDAVLAPESLFAGINKLEAATYATYQGGALATHTYWHPPQEVRENLSFREAEDELDHMLATSISSQMVADVPLGVFLSGGLDSSLVAYYAQAKNSEPVHTFSLGFEDHSYDETRYAREVAKALGTKHHEYVASAAEVRGVLQAVVQKLDEPIADPAILPNHILSRFAREHVTVALGGDGGDELFAGYQTFAAERYLGWYLRMPRAVRERVIEPLVERLPVSHRYFSLDFKAKQFMRGVHTPMPYTHQAWLESFNTKEQEDLLTPEYCAALKENRYKRIEEYLSEIPEADTHTQASYLYLRMYLEDVILAKVDRASMLTSLEVRSPLLDKNVVEFALALPWHFKQRGGVGKYILRKLMRDRLPRDIVRRKKHGFGLPVGQWFLEEWRGLLLDTLSFERVERAGMCEPKAVERLVAEHLAGTHNHRKKLWSLLVLHLWYDAWIQSL